MLTEEQVRALLFYKDLIPAIRKALMDFSAGRVRQPVRTILPVGPGGWFGVMPAVYGTVMGAKMVTFYPGNAELAKAYAYGDDPTLPRRYRRAPGHHGRAIDHRDAHRGRVRGGDRPPCSRGGEGARHSGQWGAGSLPHPGPGRYPPFTEIRVWSRSQDHAQQFASEIGATGEPRRSKLSLAPMWFWP